MDIGMNKSDLLYAKWVMDGCKKKGQEMDMVIFDEKRFPGKEEVEMDFRIFDGFAVSEYQGREYVMTYPTVKEVKANESLFDEVRAYVGSRVDETELYAEDIALTMGEITQERELPLKVQVDDYIVLMDADITHELAMDIIDKDVRQRVSELDGREMDKYFDMPETAKGRIEPGFFIIHKDGSSDYHRLPMTNAAILTDRSEAFNEYVDSLQNILQTRVVKEKMATTSDYQFIPNKENPALYDFTCKIAGEQMPTVTLNDRESAEVHAIVSKGNTPIPNPGTLFAKYPETFAALKTDTPLPKQTSLTLDGLRNRLAKKYPEGLTMLVYRDVLADVLKNGLKDRMKEVEPYSVINHEKRFFTTVLTSLNKEKQGVESRGHLMDPVRVELHLKPEDYKLIYPDMASMGGNDEVNGNIENYIKWFNAYAKADFNARLGNVDAMSFRLPKTLDVFERMTVNGQPLKEVYQLAQKQGIDTVERLGEYMALDEIRQKGTDARIQLGALGPDSIRKLNQTMNVKDMSVSDALKQNAGYMMQEKGYMDNQKENLVYTFFSDKRELLVPLAKEYYLRFPEVSMLVDDYKMEVSINSQNPRCRQEVAELTESFLMENNIPYHKEVEPFQDLSFYAKIRLGLEDGRTVDAYINRKGFTMSGAMMAMENVYGMKYEKGNVLNLYPDKEGHNVLIHMNESIQDVTKIEMAVPLTEEYNRIKDANLYRKAGTTGKNTEWMVRAVVDGEQQMGVPLKTHQNRLVNQLTGNGKNVPEYYDMLRDYMTVMQYQDVLNRSQAEKQTTGRKL